MKQIADIPIIQKVLSILSSNLTFNFGYANSIEKIGDNKYLVHSDQHLDGIPIVYALDGLKYFLNQNKSLIDCFEKGNKYKKSDYDSFQSQLPKSNKANNEALEEYYKYQDSKVVSEAINPVINQPEYFTFDFKLSDYTKEFMQILMDAKKRIIEIELSGYKVISKCINSIQDSFIILTKFILSLIFFNTSNPASINSNQLFNIVKYTNVLNISTEIKINKNFKIGYNIVIINSILITFIINGYILT